MSPDEIDALLHRTRPAPLDPALRERVLGAAQARWDRRQPSRWPLRLVLAAAAAIACDLGALAWDGSATAAAGPQVRYAAQPRPPSSDSAIVLARALSAGDLQEIPQ